MADFPSIVPTTRSFSPGGYPQRTYRSLNGVAVKRTFGNTPYGASLELTFENISDSAAGQIINHYRNQTATNSRFNLSSSSTAGMADFTLIVAGLNVLDNLRWEYAEPPQVESVHPGRSSVRVSLTGEIRNPARDD